MELGLAMASEHNVAQWLQPQDIVLVRYVKTIGKDVVAVLVLIEISQNTRDRVGCEHVVAIQKRDEFPTRVRDARVQRR